MLKKIKVKDAVGTKLTHDITEIRPGEFKGPAFRKGHTVCDEDICHLQRLGKNHLYMLEPAEDEIHEDDAAYILADALAGQGIVKKAPPKEGKIELVAEKTGLLFIDTAALAAFNMVDEVICATRHNHTFVQAGDLVAATRAIPLVMKRMPIERAAAIANQRGGIVSIRPLRSAKAGITITGNEIFNGLIEDRFGPLLSRKLDDLGSEVAAMDFAPDDPETISQTIHSQLTRGCDLLLVSGGMSVDPDDVTRHGIRLAGAQEILYGAATLPGSMFVVAYAQNVPILGLPACALHHRITVLDLILPRVLAGERIGKAALAHLGHGGLCLSCSECSYPHCPFGKGI